jgi:hypothetical protein
MKTIKTHTGNKKVQAIIMILLFFFSISASAQMFMSPKYKAKNAKNVRLVSVQNIGEQTVVSLRPLPSPSPSVYISSETYIRSSEGGEPLFIQKVEGYELDKRYDEIGLLKKDLKLYFPKIEQDVKVIDFRAGKEGNFWHFFEISVGTDIGIDLTVKSGNKGEDGNCRFIENPGYIAKSGGFGIPKIELCDTATILHFKVNIAPNGRFFVPAKSSIRDSNGGVDLFVTKAEGTKINEWISVGKSDGNEVYYKLFFPPIKRTVKKIDFREINNGGSWFVYELDTDVGDL